MNLKDLIVDRKYEVRLCKGCIADLDEYYPYLVPREQLHIIEVPVGECDNSNINDYNVRLKERNREFFRQ